MIAQREAIASAAERLADQVQQAGLRELALARAERQTLNRERGRVAEDSAMLAARVADTQSREKSITDRERTLSLSEQAHDGVMKALQAGLEDIEGGRIDNVEKLRARGDRSPAYDLLRRIGSTIAARVKEVTKDLAGTRKELAAQQTGLQEALSKAKKREEEASEMKERYETEIEKFAPELTKMRRVHELASQIIRFADNPMLRKVSSKLNLILDGLAGEVSVKRDTNERGR